MANDHQAVATPLSDLDLPAEEERVRRVVAMVEQTQRERDPEGFMRLLSSDAIWVTALGWTMRGWEEINAFTHRVLTPSLGNKYASYEVAGIKFLSSEVVAVNVRQKPIDASGNPDPVEREGRPLYVMVKHGDDWLISVAQNTQVAAELIDRQQRAIEELGKRIGLSEEEITEPPFPSHRDEGGHMKPVLYSGSRAASSWALRAWLALRLADIDFEEVMLDIRKPQRFGNLKKVSEFSPSASVPCLVAEDHMVFDSLAICELANDLSGGALLPADPWVRAEARAFASWQHSGLSQICSRISFESAFYPNKRRLTSSEQAEAARLFEATETALSRYGGLFLFGDLSIADIMLVPTAIRLMRHAPDLEAWPQTAAWMDRLLALDPVTEWLKEAAEEPHIWFEDYLVSSPDELEDAQQDVTESTAPVAR